MSIVRACPRDWGKTFNVVEIEIRPRRNHRRPDIDIVDICTPNMYHAPLAIAALDAGKHVICEKPLAPTPGDIRQMITARDRAGKLLMTAQHFRFKGTSQPQGGDLAARWATSTMPQLDAAPQRAIPTPRLHPEEHSGGGPCIDIGVHILDLTLWMMGNPQPVTVTGVAKAPLAHHAGALATGATRHPRDFDVEEFAAAFVRFENGATLVLEVSWLLHHDTGARICRCGCTARKAAATGPRPKYLSSNYATRQLYNRTLKLTKDTMEPHALECVEFARAMAEGRPSPVPAEQSLQVMSILDGIYRSQREGSEVAYYL